MSRFCIFPTLFIFTAIGIVEVLCSSDTGNFVFLVIDLLLASGSESYTTFFSNGVDGVNTLNLHFLCF